ncbi:MAG: hypothetical protein WC702_04725 [Patescibacteria group bacterium]|jgi:hypothetical protein
MVEKEQTNRPEDYFEQDGIRQYGEKVGVFEQADLESIKITTESLIHIARHLVSLSREAQSRLIGQDFLDGSEHRTIDDDFLASQLATAGSKFNPTINNPEKIVSFCLEKIKTILATGQIPFWIKDPITGNMSVDFRVVVTPEDKDNFGIPVAEKLGTASLVKITPEIADRVSEEWRGAGQAVDRIKVNVVSGVEVPMTDNLIITVKKRPDRPPVLYTAFTGIATALPPRPSEQSAEALEYNKKWWSDYAFIK